MPERQSARMSEIKSVGYTWMALNTLTPLSIKESISTQIVTIVESTVHQRMNQAVCGVL